MTVLNYKSFVEQHGGMIRTLVNKSTDFDEDTKNQYFKTIKHAIEENLKEIYGFDKNHIETIVKKVWRQPETLDIIEDCLGKYPQILPHVCAQKILTEFEHMFAHENE